MQKLTKGQAQELIGLINESNLANFFEKLDEFGVEAYEVGAFQKEFMSGKFDWSFSERLQTYVNSIAHTSFTLENPHFDIFFSFSSKNKETAENAVATLRKAGLTVFFSYDDLQDTGGTMFLRKINEALSNSQHLVLLCTPEAMKAVWVRHEYETFYAKAFIPSKKQRRLFILEGEGFDRNKLEKDDLLGTIQSSPSIESILKVLGKEMPKEDDLPERRIDYKEFFEICFVDGQINEKERKQLDKKQKELNLTDEQVAEIEAEVRQETEKEAEATLQKVEEENRQKALAEETVELALADSQRKEEEEKAAALALAEAEKRREEEEKQRKIDEAVRKQDWDTWQRAIYDNNIDAYQYYLGLFPEGIYAEDAKQNLQSLKDLASIADAEKEAKRKEEEAAALAEAEKQEKLRQEKEQAERNEKLRLQQLQAEQLRKQQAEEELRKATMSAKANTTGISPKGETTGNTSLYVKLVGGASLVIASIFGVVKCNDNRNQEAAKLAEQQKVQIEQQRITDSIVNSEIADKTILEQIGKEMVWVEGGSFKMGCDKKRDGECQDNEKPLHQVQVASFYMSKYEVTQVQWKALMGDNPSNFTDCDNCPVESVSWNDIQTFLKKLNKQTGKNYRLPTEEEWEYAARGGNQSNGYKYAGSNSIGDVAWYYDNSNRRTQLVGQKSPNELGIYDMTGNVWEWTASGWSDNYEKPRTLKSYVLRGGSWDYIVNDNRVTYRSLQYPANSYSIIGFRLCFSQY